MVEDRVEEALRATPRTSNEHVLAAALRKARDENERLRDQLAWGETFLARHDAFMQKQTPQIAYAMRDAADGFRAALAVSPPADEAKHE